MTTLSIAGFFIYLYLPQTARTSDFLLPFSLAIFSGVLITVSAYLYTDVETTFPIVYSFLNTAFWVGYIFWYSRFGRTESELLKVGETLPQFFVEDVDGYPQTFHGSQRQAYPLYVLPGELVSIMYVPDT